MKTYTVKPGDTLSCIAEAFGVSFVSLVTLNKIMEPDYIVVGQELKLPLSRADELEQELARVREERDAVVAHAEWLHQSIEACIADDERKFVFSPDDFSELERALDATFANSLTRRDLLKQAEALELIVSAGELMDTQSILAQCHSLRQRAKELSHD